MIKPLSNLNSKICVIYGVFNFSHEFHELSRIKITVARIKANSRKKENLSNF